MKNKNRFHFTLLFLLSATIGFSQSPWVNPKGSSYTQLSTTFLSYSSVFNDQGNVDETDFSTSDMTIGFFGDYSLSNKFAVTINFPIKSVEFNEEELSGLGDPRIRFKYQISGHKPLTVYAGYTAPLSERTGPLRTGYNQHALELGLSKGFSKNDYYGYGSLGYRYRTNIADQILIGGEIGTSISAFNRPLFLIFNLDGAINLSTEEDDDAANSVLYHNNSEFLSPGIKVSYNIFDHFWINAGGAGAFQAKNLGAAPTLSIGIAYNVKKNGETN